MAAIQSTTTGLRTFEAFPKLPVEIRCQIWTHAAPRRPRIIQVCFDAETSKWTACKDGCGGLPSIVHVSREARVEALKPYTKAFDALINLDEDVVFISDPVFTIRKPQQIFLKSEFTPKLKSVAFTSDIFKGIAASWESFPSWIDSPGALLRRFEGLRHFTLALMEDGAGFEEDHLDMGDNERFDFDEAEEEEAEADLPGGDGGNTVGPVHGQADARSTSRSAVRKRLLESLEQQAMERMSKHFFRHVGNIHFESAMINPDHLENWWWYREEVVDTCRIEKEEHPDWVQPMISIMAIRYGLKKIGDYGGEIHSLGDHTEGVIEVGGSDFEFEHELSGEDSLDSEDEL